MIRREGVDKKYYLLSFVITVFIALLFLFFAAFLPQTAILRNVNESVPYLKSEGYYPWFFDHSNVSKLDNYTDIQMLRAAASTHNGKIDSILTNDLHSFEKSESIIDDLESYASGTEEAISVSHYVRYWMGFRVILRLALVFLNYVQIRRYLAVVFFCLMIAVVCQMGKHINSKCAYLFALSVILVHPNVIVNSMQYSCCFLITFLSMLLIPWLFRNPKWDGLFFMEIGMLTMYFDFYTVPLITFGYPMIYLIAMQSINGRKIHTRKVCGLFLFWLAGWVFMWIAKLGLTSLLTEINAIADGFNSFLGRIGFVKHQELLDYYSIPYAFSELARIILKDRAGAIVYMLGAAVCLTAVFCVAIKNKVSLFVFLKYKPFLLIALMPIVWFVITAQPIAIHAWFQYRSVAIIYWGLGTYFYMILSDKDAACKQSESK